MTYFKVPPELPRAYAASKDRPDAHEAFPIEPATTMKQAAERLRGLANAFGTGDVPSSHVLEQALEIADSLDPKPEPVTRA
jgi:hypothetical protein